MRMPWALALALGVAGAASAAPLLPERSAIEFTGRQMGVPVRGRFTAFSGDIVFDPARLAQSRARIVVQTASIDVGLAEGNEALRAPEWFDAEARPRAEFESRGFKDLGGGRYELTGELSLKGVKRSLRLPLRIARTADGQWQAEARFTLRRLDFALGTGDWADTETVADTVELRVRLVAPAH